MDEFRKEGPASDDEMDEEALRLLALQSLAKPKYINTHNLISIVPVNEVTDVAPVNIKLEPISPKREEKFLLEDSKESNHNESPDSKESSDEEVSEEEPFLDVDDEDSLDRLMDKLEAEIEGKPAPARVKKKKKKKKERKLEDEEVKLVEVKIGKSKPDAPVIDVRESLSPEPKRSPFKSRSRTRSRSIIRTPRRSWSRSPLPKQRFRSRSRSPFLRRRTRSPSRSPYRRRRSRSRSPYRPLTRYRSRSLTPLRRRSRSPRRSRSRSPRRSPRRWSRSPPPRRKRSPLRVSPRRSLSAEKSKARSLRRSLSPRERRKPPLRRSPPRRRSPRRRSVDKNKDSKEKEKKKEDSTVEKKEDVSEESLNPVLEARRRKFQSVPDPSCDKKINLKAVKDTIEPLDDENDNIHVNEALFDDDDEDSDEPEGRFKGAERESSRSVLSFRGIREGQTVKVPTRLEALGRRSRSPDIKRHKKYHEKRARPRGNRRETSDWPSAGALRERNTADSAVSKAADENPEERPRRKHEWKKSLAVEKKSDTENETAPSLVVDDFEALVSDLEKALETEEEKSLQKSPVNISPVKLLQPKISVKKDLFDLPPVAIKEKRTRVIKRKVEATIEVDRTMEEDISSDSFIHSEGEINESNPSDLRTVLARKRRERQVKKQDVPKSRLVQSAFQSLIRKEEDRSHLSTRKPRRVLVVSDRKSVIPLDSGLLDDVTSRPRRRVQEVNPIEDFEDDNSAVVSSHKFRLKRSVTIASQVK